MSRTRRGNERKSLRDRHHAQLQYRRVHLAGQPLDGVLLAPDGAGELVSSDSSPTRRARCAKPFFSTISSPARLTSASILDSSTRSERLAAALRVIRLDLGCPQSAAGSPSPVAIRSSARQVSRRTPTAAAPRLGCERGCCRPRRSAPPDAIAAVAQRVGGGARRRADAAGKLFARAGEAAGSDVALR